MYRLKTSVEAPIAPGENGARLPKFLRYILAIIAASTAYCVISVEPLKDDSARLDRCYTPIEDLTPDQQWERRGSGQRCQIAVMLWGDPRGAAS
jgi:hypothetical protein